MDLRGTVRFASDAEVPEAPAEVFEVPHGLLSRTRESDAGQLAHAVGAGRFACKSEYRMVSRL
jgi:hypothetical protein